MAWRLGVTGVVTMAVTMTAAARPPAHTAVPASARVYTVALSRTNAGLWTAPVTLAGGRRPYRFVVDTGSERTVLSAAAARALDVPLVRGPILLTPAGRLDAEEAVLSSLDVGGLTLPAVPVVVADLRSFGRGWPMDGILGMDVLGRGDLLLDLERGVLTMARRLPAPAGVALPGHAVGGRRIVAARVDGRERALVLDTGAATFVVFEAASRGVPVRVGGAGTSTVAWQGRAEVAVGDVHLGGVPIVRLPPIAGRAGSDGLLPGTMFTTVHIAADGGVHVVPRRRP